MDNRGLAHREIDILCASPLIRPEFAHRLYSLLDKNLVSYKSCCEKLGTFDLHDSSCHSSFLNVVYLLYLYIDPNQATITRCLRSESSIYSSVASQHLECRFTNRFGKLCMENSPMLIKAVYDALHPFFTTNDDGDNDANGDNGDNGANSDNSKTLPTEFHALYWNMSTEKRRHDDDLVYYANPLSMFDNPITCPFDILEKFRVESYVDAMCVIQRLKSLPLQIHETIQYLEKQRSLKGVELPQLIAQGFYDSLTSVIQIDPPRQEFMASFEKDLAEHNVSHAYYDLALEILRDSVYRALHHIKEWVYEFFLEEDDVSEQSNDDVDDAGNAGSARNASDASDANQDEHVLSDFSICCDRTKGQKYYAYCLAHHTTTDMSPEEIHKLGKSEVNRISQDMLCTIQQIDSSVESVEQAMEYIRKISNDPSQIYQDNSDGEKEMLDRITELDLIIKSKLDDLFVPGTLPQTQCEYKFTPNHQKQIMPAGYYMVPSFDGKTKGAYYTNLAADLVKFDLATLVAHEAIPGHHFQLSIVAESDAHPITKIEFYNQYNAYVEGWGLYSEKLGKDIGLYDDSYDMIGHLVAEILRASRLVIDTGLHYYGWSRTQALEYMNSVCPCPNRANEIEIDRYIGWPGQATSYKVGELKILELRKQALESGKTLQEFNSDMINKGNVPLIVL